MTMRLSIISLAGMARTLVAVGTSSDADMFFTTAAAAPRRTWASSPSARGVAFAAGFASAALGLAGATSVLAAGGSVSAGGAAFLAGAGSAFAGAVSVLAVGAPLPPAVFGAGAGPGSGGAVGADGSPSPALLDVSAVGSGE